MTAFPKPCGRLDRHDEHEWTRPALPNTPERTFNCVGRVILEGGYYADWDAEDDAREEQQRDDRIEDELMRRALSTWGNGEIG